MSQISQENTLGESLLAKYNKFFKEQHCYGTHLLAVSGSSNVAKVSVKVLSRLDQNLLNLKIQVNHKKHSSGGVL